MQLFSTTSCLSSSSASSQDFVALTSLLGLYFQIRDDYANLCLEEYEQNKSFAEDLTEGKYSFPIIHAIRCHKVFGGLQNQSFNYGSFRFPGRPQVALT